MSTLRESVLRGLLDPQSSPLEPPATTSSGHVGHGNSLEEVRRKQLVQRLEELKRVQTYWQEQVDRLKNSNQDRRVSDLQSQIENLLQSNDDCMENTKNNATATNTSTDKELIKKFSTLPDRSDEALTGMFHHLHFDPIVSSKLISRDVLLNEFKGYCMGDSDGSNPHPIFEFHIWLYISPYKESVHGIRVTVSPWIRKELRELINRAAEAKDILLLMHGISRYADMALRRLRVFRKLASKYPVENGMWQEGSSLTFTPQNHTGSQLVLRWPVSIDSQGEAESTPTVDFRPSSEWQKNDTTNILKQYKQVYRHLIELKGVYKATCLMHNLLYDD